MGEAESAYSSVDPNAHGKHDPIQRQEASLEENQAQALNEGRREDLKPLKLLSIAAKGEGRRLEGIWGQIWRRTFGRRIIEARLPGVHYGSNIKTQGKRSKLFSFFSSF